MRLVYKQVHVCVSAHAAVSRWPMGPSPSARLCAMPAAAAGADAHRKRGSANGPSLPACTAPGAALGGRVSYSSGSPRRSYFRCVVAGPHSAVETLSPGCASSALAGSMGFPDQQKEWLWRHLDCDDGAGGASRGGCCGASRCIRWQRNAERGAAIPGAPAPWWPFAAVDFSSLMV